DGSAFAEGRTQLRQHFYRRVGPRRLIHSKRLNALLAANFNRNDLVGELACLLGSAKALLRARSEAILRLAGELRQGDEVLRVPARVFAGESIIEAIAKHAVVDHCRTHAIAPTAPIH